MGARVADPLVGRVLDGRYAVRSRIARGGMATVYLAVDQRLDREVALKVMHPHFADDEEFVQRFSREARSAARLSHPGVVQVFDQGEHDGVVFLAMEHVPGRTLRDLMRERGPLTAREALDVFEPMLDALAAAHRAGIVHRDVKPENVLLGDDGRIKVADFGLARAVNSATTSQTGLLLGTVAYLAPEQVERGVADARSDVYAAGVLLFEMITGAKPFAGETAVQIAFQHVTSEVPAPSSRASGVPSAMDDLVASAAARAASERPADARELLMLVRETRHRMTPEELDCRVERVRDDQAATDSLAGTAGTAGGLAADHTMALNTMAFDVRPPGTRAPGTRAPGTRVAETGAIEVRDAETGALELGDRPDAGRRRRPWGRVALVAVLLLAVLLGLGGWYLGAGPGAYTRVPTVAHLSQQAAERALSARGLDVRVTSSFDEDVPAGQVMTVDPTDGTRLRKNGTVTLLVSRGQERYAVPKLVGRTEAAARRALTGGHLAVGEVSREYDEQVVKGHVVSASADQGTTVKPATKVDLVVSRGRQPIEIPSYVGRPADEASRTLRDAGFDVAITEQYDDTVPRGDVVAQDPSSGTGFRGTKVSLTVSKGPELVTVPTVVGKQVDEARRILTEQGFGVQVAEILGGFFGTVRSQNPGSGTSAPRGSTVTIRVV